MEIHTVKKGDTLTEIVQKRFPGERIWGKDGNIYKVLNLNPEIKNRDLIYEGQDIFIRKIQGENTEIADDTKESLDKIYGLTLWGTLNTSFYAFTQTGDLLKSDLFLTSFNSQSVGFEYDLKGYLLRGKFERSVYDFSYQGDNFKETLSSKNLGVTYKYFRVGYEQLNNLFFYETTGYKSAKTEESYLNLGLEFRHDLKKYFIDEYILFADYSHPLEMTSDSSLYKINSYSGYRFSGKAVLQKNLNKRLKLNATVDFKHSSFEFKFKNGQKIERESTLTTLGAGLSYLF